MLAMPRPPARAMAQAKQTTNGSDASDATLEDERDVRSLVCESCWNGPFAHDSFQKAWHATEVLDGFSYTTSWKELGNSAEAGCNWCQLLVTKISSLFVSEGPREPQQDFKVWTCFNKPALGQDFAPARSAFWIGIDGFPSCHDAYAAPGNDAAKYVKARDRVWQMSSPASFERASEWLEECTNEHELCSELLTPHPTLPTRVIDCLDPERPKLYISSGSQGIYAALSYVWGGPQHHSVRKDNVDEYVKGMELERLPQTIIDAITATSRLGIRYLWVDSLCILQDSEEDKTHELAQMCHIYRDAYVTIVAASAKSANEGFLHDRPPPPPAVPLPFRCPDGKIGVVSLRSQERDSPEPVETRAWCFQEWLLSPRSLVFASHTLQYHCHTHSIHTLPEKVRFPSTLLKSSLPTSLSESLIADSKLLDDWHEIVDEYCKRGISYPSDKLVALLGIAEMFSHVWSTSMYLAGLWQHGLLEELLWRHSGTRYARPAAYRAPSWSWAASDGWIYPDSCHDAEPVCEILQCDVTLASELLPFGKVTNGILRLDAVLKQVLWDPGQAKMFALDSAVPDSEPTSIDSQDASSGDHCRDCAEDASDSSDSEASSAPSEGASLGHADPDCVEEASEAPGQVWAMPLVKDRKMLKGLIVVPDSISTKGYFRRVGSFVIYLSYDGLLAEDGTDVGVWLTTPRQEVTIV